MRWRQLVIALGASSLISLTGVAVAAAATPAGVTRGAFVTELAEALNVAPEPTAAPKFQDVRPGMTDYGYIEAAADLGWVDGLPGGRFAPDAPLTREAMAKILVEAVGLGPEAKAMAGAQLAYQDAAQIAPWARGYVAAASWARLLKGMPNGAFDPTGPLSAAEANTVVQDAVHYLASQPGNIMGLTHIATVASTVDRQNGDQNPYGLTYDSFPGTATAPNPFYGDLLVSNFSDKNGTNGAGTTVEAVNPDTGAVSRFTGTASGPVALAVSPKGPVWIANFGTSGTNGNDEVTTPNGGLFPNGGSIITNPALDGPWGQVFVPGATPAFLVTNVLNGTIDAMYDFGPPNFNTDTKFLQIGSGLATNGSTTNPAGPQGMVYDPATGKVYVTDTADNSIRAYTWSGPTTPDQGTGQLVYQGGALKGPVGITLDPINGDLLVVNQGNNNLVEIALRNGVATVVGQRVLDPTPVNPETGAGSALFGVYAMTNATGALHVFYTDDNTNSLNVLY